MDEDEMAGLAAQIGAFSLRKALGAAFGGGGRPRPRPRAAPGNWGGMFAPPAPKPNPYQYDQGYSPQFDQVVPNLPGTPNRQLGIAGAAFPPFVFTAAVGTATLTQQMNPQAVLRGRRLVCTVIRNGASALTTAPLVRTIQVGMVPMVLTPDGLPADQFAPNAIDTNMLFPGTCPGVVYVITMSLTATLAGADTVLVLASVQGSSPV